MGKTQNRAGISSRQVGQYNLKRLREDEAVWREVDASHEDNPHPPDPKAIAEATGVPLRSVRRTLAHPEIYSAYVDWIAVRRALHFDWPVIERLTVRELLVVAHALRRRYTDEEIDALSQPWGDPTSDELAWMAGTPTQRDFIRNLVRDRGDSEEAREAYVLG